VSLALSGIPGRQLGLGNEERTKELISARLTSLVQGSMFLPGNKILIPLCYHRRYH